MEYIKKSLLMVLFMTAPIQCVAVQAADFSGKTIQWIVPFDVGGGTDRWARFYAPLLSEALPGKPKVSVKNIVGSSSIKGANRFANDTKADGLTILGTSGSTLLPYLLSDSRVNYDYQDWQIILGSPTSGVVYVPSKLGIQTANDLKRLKTPLLFGSIGLTSLDSLALLAFDMLGVEVEVLFGMKGGRSSSRQAFERGMFTIDYQTTPAYLAHIMPLVDVNEVVPMMSWGVFDETGNIVRDPNFPNLPTFPEIYEEIHGKSPSGLAWKAWKALYTAGFPTQKMLFLPQGTPQNIVETYTAALNTIITSPNFMGKSKEHLGVYHQKIGVEAEKSLKTAINFDEGSQIWLKKWLKEKYQ